MSNQAQSQMAQRLTALQQRMLQACERAGRDPSAVSLLPVSKTFDHQAVQTAMSLGLTRFGENRLSDIQQRVTHFSPGAAEWVMIGHVQSNKARDVARYVDELQSLDRVSVAEALDRRLQQEGRQLRVLIQLKTAQEDSKTGLAPSQLVDFLQLLQQNYSSLVPCGVMTMATQTEDRNEIRRCFRVAREALEQTQQAGYELSRLSMGMSNDFELAIEEGSTEIRVGSALFGVREYSNQ